MIEPRNSVVVVIGITALGSQRGKADGLLIPEGSSLGGIMAKSLGQHRGLRAGHALTGATRELGRACCLPPGEPEGMGHRLNKAPGVGRAVCRAHRRVPLRAENTNEAVQPRVSGDESEEQRTSRKATGSPLGRLRTSLAEHSTDEGGDPRPKGSTRGKEKPGIAFQWKEIGERL